MFSVVWFLSFYCLVVVVFLVVCFGFFFLIQALDL